MPARVEISEEIARIVLSGDADFSTQRDLADAMDRAINSAGVKEIRVDMVDTTFIDSSVIRSLLKLQEMAVASGKTVSIWNCNERIREIFTIGGFDRMFVLR
jgi:anti-anti-sigma factor